MKFAVENALMFEAFFRFWDNITAFNNISTIK
jgi:hypothetical protein